MSRNFHCLIVLYLIRSNKNNTSPLNLSSLSGATSAMYPYVGELLTTTTRSKLMALIGFAIGMGIMYSTGVGWALQRYNVHLDITDNYTLHPWRIQMILALIPAALAGFICYCLPESPKYLVSIGRTDKAMAVLNRIHVSNGKSPDDFPIKALKEEMSTSNKKTL